MTRRRRRTRNPLFRKRWFADDSIIQCVNWYLRFKVSLPRSIEIMRQLGVSVAPCTILRWVILSRTRDIGAAKAFFRKAFKRHGEPRSITLDGFEPSHSALRRIGMRNEFNFRWGNAVKIRSCQDLNNIVEQDHRPIKARVQPMLGFKKFYNARRAYGPKTGCGLPGQFLT